MMIKPKPIWAILAGTVRIMTEPKTTAGQPTKSIASATPLSKVK